MENKKTARLKNLLIPGKPLICPGAYDVLSAKIIEKIGFQALQVSGFGVAGSILGLPDIAVLSLTQMLDVTRNICHAVNIPVMADGDTGFGNAVNVYYTVQMFEDAGAAGINLEDQVFPKRCGHMDGKMVIETEEMIGKIRAAADARRDPDFIINARTDAGTLYGIDEAIRRGQAYLKAGADMIFIEAPKISKPEDIKRAVKEIGGKCSLGIVLGGKAPILTYEQYCDLGLARLSFPVAPIAAAAHGMEVALTHLFEEKSFADEDRDLYWDFKQYTDFIGLPDVHQLERRYMSDEALEERYKP